MPAKKKITGSQVPSNKSREEIRNTQTNFPTVAARASQKSPRTTHERAPGTQRNRPTSGKKGRGK